MNRKKLPLYWTSLSELAKIEIINIKLTKIKLVITIKLVIIIKLEHKYQTSTYLIIKIYNIELPKFELTNSLPISLKHAMFLMKKNKSGIKYSLYFAQMETFHSQKQSGIGVLTTIL